MATTTSLSAMNPHLGLQHCVSGLLDGLRAIGSEPGHERQAQIRNAAAERPIDQMRGPVLGIHLRYAAGQALQG